MSSSMKGWQLNDYSGIEALNFKEDLKIPTIQTPTDVLIKVEVCLFVCLFITCPVLVLQDYQAETEHP
jgi:hypothetical protein